MSTTCACGASIDFVTTPAGKKMPVNVEQLRVIVEKGGPVRAVLADGRVVACRLANLEGDEKLEVVVGRTSHFASCSVADRFRAKGRTAP